MKLLDELRDLIELYLIYANTLIENSNLNEALENLLAAEK